MITSVYPSAAHLALTGSMTPSLRLVLLDATYAFSLGHDSYTDLTGMVVNATSPSGGFTLTGVAATAGATSSTLSADQVSVNPATVTFRSYAVYQDTGSKPLLVHADFGTNIAVSGTALVLQLSNILTVEA